MFQPHPSIKSLILMAAGVSAIAATGASAAPVASSTQTGIETAQSFADNAQRQRRANRSAPSGDRLEAFRQSQPQRVDNRTAIYEQAANVEASDVQARLDAGEEAVLQALAEADTAAITQAANQIGVAAGQALEQAPGTYLSEEQTDTLVAAAARAAEISEQEVDQLLKAGSLAIESYEGLDAEQIASNLNQIGNKALELQAARYSTKEP